MHKKAVVCVFLTYNRATLYPYVGFICLGSEFLQQGKKAHSPRQ